MKPDPTISVSLDYLVELSDDGDCAEETSAETIIIPPIRPTDDNSANAPGTSDV